MSTVRLEIGSNCLSVLLVHRLPGSIDQTEKLLLSKEHLSVFSRVNVMIRDVSFNDTLLIYCPPHDRETERKMLDEGQDDIVRLDVSSRLT
ncbi:hypothetical protein JOB18_043908 [Solea senegalensis]|uniref:Uncharacterized protein n=1 Tax=Solea senegalensis TaxID=28829 RepID=A0AAV6TBJ1_SOLSE|nr:hypothetical protein JOB18_043908 [Solea senegalensis]